jgi:phosphonate transport system substrate-binding protein
LHSLTLRQPPVSFSLCGTFRTHGIPDYRTYFKEVYFTGTHEDAIYDVLNRKADIGAAKSTILNRLARTDERIGRDLKFLSRSPDVPETALVLRKDLNPEVKKNMRTTLLAMHNDPVRTQVLKQFGAARFVAVSDKDYEPVREYARYMGLNLERYPYRDAKKGSRNQQEGQAAAVTVDRLCPTTAHIDLHL